jgi:threonine synthase
VRYFSTRDQIAAVTFSEGLLMGLAPDGGLLIPEVLPTFSDEQISEFSNYSFIDLAKTIAKKFAKNDILENQIDKICDDAFNFPIILKNSKNHTAILELFHGPTCAFKDVGARFLASAISQLQSIKKEKLTVIVATSGDTGSAVASAFFQKPFVEVIVLYPDGKISPRQEIQLTCWGENIKSFAITGFFDDCQRIVKEAFLNPWWKSNKELISANSISIGRILPQTFYYAWASLKYFSEFGKKPGFIIPSGNLGNATACLWAKKMGFPIREIVMSTNINHAVLDYSKNGQFLPHPTISTLANAMDVGNPSNMERVLNLFKDYKEFQKEISVLSVNDNQISECIAQGEKKWGEIFCPHTATAVYAREQLQSQDWIIVATAHPAKFETIVEPLIQKSVIIPAALEKLLKKKITKKILPAELEKLKLEIL